MLTLHPHLITLIVQSFEKKVNEYLEKSGLIKDNCFVYKELSEMQLNAMLGLKMIRIGRDVIGNGIKKDGEVNFTGARYSYISYEEWNSFAVVLLIEIYDMLLS